MGDEVMKVLFYFPEENSHQNGLFYDMVVVAKVKTCKLLLGAEERRCISTGYYSSLRYSL